jgi:hypothetical protein
MKLFYIAPALLFLLGACQKTETAAPDINYSGKLTTSGAVNFKGLCTWSAEYVNSVFDVKLDNSNQKVLYANISTTMKEKLITGSCIPASQQSQHVYTLSAFSISGNSLAIYFMQDTGSFPQNTASFSGTIASTGIAGTLTLYRKSDGIFCKVEMPFQLAKTN